MITKYHISPASGQPSPCGATYKCPFGEPEDHYESKAEARENYEKQMAAGLFTSHGGKWAVSPNVYATVSSAPEDSLSISDEEVEYSRGTLNFVPTEFFTAVKRVDDYNIRVAILDEDQLPLATAVIDLYDNPQETAQALGFASYFIDDYSNRPNKAQLEVLLKYYTRYGNEFEMPTKVEQKMPTLSLANYVLRNAPKHESPEAALAQLKAYQMKQPKNTYVTELLEGDEAYALGLARDYSAAKDS